MKFKIVLSAAVTATLLSACASPPHTIPAAYVSDRPFQEKSCAALEADLERNAEQASPLQFDLKDKANVDAVQAGLTVLFFPMAIFLEGGDGDDAREYARLKGERKALVSAVKAKNCAIDLSKTDVMAAPCIPSKGKKCPSTLEQRLPILN